MTWKEFLKPTKQKVFFSFVFTSLFLSLIYVLQLTLIKIEELRGATILRPVEIKLTTENYPLIAIFTILGFLIYSLFSYPFGCSLSLIYGLYKKNELGKIIENKRLLATVVITFLIFNPFTLNVGMFSFYWFALPVKECGAIFRNVIPDSPAERVGLKPGMIIVKIDNQAIHNINDFINVMDTKKPEERIKITTAGGSIFTLTLDQPPAYANYTHGFIGIGNVTTAWVKRIGECA